MLQSIPETNQYWVRRVMFLAQRNSNRLRWGLNSYLTGIHW